VTALVTPLTGDMKVNDEALRRLIEFQLRNEVSGFFILGTYGEGLSIHPNTRKLFAERVAEYVGSRVPIINCVSSTSIDVSIELARHSADLGMRHIALLPPLYYRVGMSELLKFYREFDRLGLDMLIYNNPQKTGIDITPTIFRTISTNVDSLVGIKDSTSSIERIAELTEEFSSEYYIAVASDIMILEAFLYKADSHVCGICNAIPELSRSILMSIARGDIDTAIRYKRYISRIKRISRELYIEGVSLVKAVLGIRGIDVGDPILPNRSLEEKELLIIKNTVKSVLDNMGIQFEAI
jgi:dihydrodipicolinate synthase/N-acetylneuraminate lyase